MNEDLAEKCPCGSAKTRNQCCGVYLTGKAEAPTPEALMRSRYVAYCDQNLDYIWQTTDPQTRQKFDYEATAQWANSSRFVGLEILHSSMDGNKGQVEFKARFKTGDDSEQLHHELSKFRKQAGIWYFREGKMKSNV